MVARIKQIPQARWDKDLKVWQFPVTQFHAGELRKFAQEHQFMVDPNLSRLVVPPKVSIQVEGLRQYQNKGVEFFTQAKGRVLCADVMGLGKTITTLGYIKHHKISNILVVAGASLLLKWVDEITKWLPDYTYQIINGRNAINGSNITLVSFNQLTVRSDMFMKYKWDLLVIDECHNISNIRTLRYRIVNQLKADQVVGLSGTPFLNRPIELWGSLSIIAPSLFDNYWKYAYRYCNAHKDEWGHMIISGHSNEAELRKIISPMFIRRTKEDVASELPKLSRVKIPVDIETKVYEHARNEAKTAVNMVASVTTLRHALGALKASAAVNIARDILSDDEQKVVLYCVHRDVVSAIRTSLREFKVVTVVGDMSQQDRHDAIEKFQRDRDYRVMIISKAGGEGIDLFRASHIIFVEREWNPGKEEQAESRLHRIGQERNVTAYYIVAKNTLDENIDELIESKRIVFANIIGIDDIESSIMSEIYSKIIGG